MVRIKSSRSSNYWLIRGIPIEIVDFPMISPPRCFQKVWKTIAIKIIILFSAYYPFLAISCLITYYLYCWWNLSCCLTHTYYFEVRFCVLILTSFLVIDWLHNILMYFIKFLTQYYHSYIQLFYNYIQISLKWGIFKNINITLNNKYHDK